MTYVSAFLAVSAVALALFGITMWFVGELMVAGVTLLSVSFVIYFREKRLLE